MKYTQTPVPDILDVFMLKGDQAMLHDTINILFQVCVELLLESISCIIILWMLEKVLLFHILSSCCKYSLHLVSKLIQASKSTFSFSDHTTESLLPVHRSLLRLLLNPSVKFIAILWTLILLPISILQNNFPCMHSPPLQPCQSFNNHRQDYLSTHNIFDVFTSMYQCPQAISRFVYNYNLYA